MIALRNVLVAVDFSEGSDRAIDQARQIAEPCGAAVHLLHVVTEPLHETWACYAPGADFIAVVRDLEADARKRLRAIQREAPRVFQAVATAWGEPTSEVLHYAAAHDIDLIVCGTHGRTGWDHVMMGSVAERIVRLARCPVLTVPTKAAEQTVAA